MKKNKTFKSLTIAILLLSAFIISCDFEGVTDDFEIGVNTAIFKQEILVEIFDPVNQSNLVGDDVLKVEIIGKDADKIVTEAGELASAAKIVDGLIALAINPNKNPNNQPIEFLLKVSGENYLTTTIPIFLSDTDSIATISANVVNKLNTPNGIDYVKSTETLVNNTLGNDVVIETSGTKANTTSEVKIKAGTIFKDIDGNVISGATIVSEIVHFNNSNSEALASFPGGFMPQEVTDENGDIVNNAYFETAGFVSIDMIIGNKEVKSFSEPIEIKMKVSSDYINPDTGNTVKEGEEIPVWSYSKDNGKWDFHTKGIVSKESNGDLVVTYTTTHLSWYNLDYYGTRCSGWTFSNGRWTFKPGVKINISMNGVNSSNAHRLYTNFVFAGTNQPVSYWSGKSKSYYDGQTFELLNTPNRNLQMIVYSGKSRYAKGNELYRSSPFNPCTGNVNFDVSSITSQLPNYVNINVDFKGICNGKTVAPSLYIQMRDPNESRFYWRYIGYLRNGKMTIYNVELNKEYEFRTYYKGTYRTYTSSFNKTDYIDHNYQIPQEMCDDLF